MSLTGKICVVTGASKGYAGIGRATALRLAKDGATVVVNYNSDPKGANDVVTEIGADRAMAFQADVSSMGGCDKLIEGTINKYGRIDVLIPSAASSPISPLEKTTEADFDAAFSINVKGPYFLVQKAVPHMAEGGRIILVSTGVTTMSTVSAPYLLYAATKGSIEQMVRVLAKDLAKKGILVNAVAPGPTGTDLFYNGKTDAMLKMVAGFSPFNRIGTPEEIADVFAFLAGPDSRWVSGQVLNANGAMC